MAFSSTALKPAIAAALRADTTLRGLLTGSTSPAWSIYDNVPELTAYPYVNFGQTITAADDTMSYHGNSVTLELHVWSQYLGTKEIDGIVERIIQLLDPQPQSFVPLPLAAPYVHIGTWLDQVMNLPVESDGRTRHAVIRLRIETQGG